MIGVPKFDPYSFEFKTLEFAVSFLRISWICSMASSLCFLRPVASLNIRGMDWLSQKPLVSELQCQTLPCRATQLSSCVTHQRGPRRMLVQAVERLALQNRALGGAGEQPTLGEQSKPTNGQESKRRGKSCPLVSSLSYEKSMKIPYK